jgi:hypothetical protein
MLDTSMMTNSRHVSLTYIQETLLGSCCMMWLFFVVFIAIQLIEGSDNLVLSNNTRPETSDWYQVMTVMAHHCESDDPPDDQEESKYNDENNEYDEEAADNCHSTDNKNVKNKNTLIYSFYMRSAILGYTTMCSLQMWVPKHSTKLKTQKSCYCMGINTTCQCRMGFTHETKLQNPL